MDSFFIMSAYKQHIQERLSGQLPGEAAHFKMAPEHREAELKAVDMSRVTPKQSAVLILLFEKEGELQVVFIRRSDYVGIHAGQIAFAGGRYEESDGDLRITALREVEEEIGIAADKIEILGVLSDLYVPPSNFMVRPFVGFLKEEPTYQLDTREVKSIHEIPLKVLMDEEIIREKSFFAHGTQHDIKAPYYHAGDVHIWGASAMILTEFIDTIK